MSVKDSPAIRLLSNDDYDRIDVLLSLVHQEPLLNIKFQEYTDIIIPKISQKLARTQTKLDGFRMLIKLLDTPLRKELLESHAAKWMEQCNNSLKNPNHRTEAYAAMKQILQQCSKVHELDRNTVNGVLSELISSFSHFATNDRYNVLKLLEVALSEYSKTCGGHRHVIEKFLIKSIDTDDRNEIILAAKCCHLLQQTGGGGEQGSNYKVAWARQFNYCIDAIVEIASELYADFSENVSLEALFAYKTSDQNGVNTKQSNIGPLQTFLMNISSLDYIPESTMKDKSIFRTLILSRRLQNLLIFVQAMLIEPFQSVKRFNPGKLMQVLVMTLSVAQKEPAVVFTAANLNVEILNTMLALILSLKGNVLPHTDLICKMCLQILKWSRFEDIYHLQKPFKHLRIKAYKTLINIFLTIGSFKIPNYDGEHSMEDELIEHILNDILPQKQILQLKTSKEGKSKSNSKKAKKSKSNHSIENTFSLINSSLKGSQDRDVNDDELAIQAAGCLEIIYFVSGSFLKHHNHKMIHEQLVEFIYTGNMSSKLQEAICKTLLAIQRYTPICLGTLTPYCVAIYSKLQTGGSSSRVREVSGFALSQCMESIRGMMPPITLPPEENLEKSNTRKRRHNDSNNIIEMGGVIEESSDDECVLVQDEDRSSKKNKVSNESTINKSTDNLTGNKDKEDVPMKLIEMVENENTCSISPPAEIPTVKKNTNEDEEIIDEEENEIAEIETVLPTEKRDSINNVEQMITEDTNEKMQDKEDPKQKDQLIENPDINEMLNDFVDETIIDLEN